MIDYRKYFDKNISLLKFMDKVRNNFSAPEYIELLPYSRKNMRLYS